MDKLKEGETVDLNHAEVSELLRIPGVGERNAADLIAARPFTDWKDVRDSVRNFGPKNQEWLSPWVTFGEPKQTKRRTRRSS